MLNSARKQKDFFLPDFCETQSVFFVILIAELLAIIFTALSIQPETSLWNSLGLYSISIQIVTLCSVSILCLLRPVLANYSDWIAGLMSLAIILIVTYLFTLGLFYWYWISVIDLANPAQAYMLTRNLLLSGLIGSITLRYFYLQQQYRKQLLLESSARLEALQARIRPHFLFNSMNVIASLTRIDPAKAESAIEDLADLFRATLSNNQELIPFEEELKNSERYLAIEKLRLGERLSIKKEIAADAMTVFIPPLSLQPLLENAVYHGIQMLAEGGEITLKANIQNQMLIIEIDNPKTEPSSRSGHGIALANISQRLEVLYKGKASLTHGPVNDSYQVIMKVPLKIESR